MRQFPKVLKGFLMNFITWVGIGQIWKWRHFGYLPVRGECQLLVSWGAVPVQSDGLNSALSPVVYGDIALSINT